MNSDAPVALVACALFLTIGWIGWVIFSSIRRYRIARLQAEMQAKLFEKLDSSQNLIAYIETESGRTLLNSLTLERETPYGRIIGSVQAGIVLSTFGGALLILRAAGEIAPEQLIFGTLAVGLGVGFGLAAIASYFLSRSFGLLERTPRP